MKKKICISVDKTAIEQINVHLEDGIFRNKSHFIELAIKHFLEVKK